jgi:uncharacterized protein (DUF2384 family)
MLDLHLVEVELAVPGDMFSEEEIQAMQRAVINLFGRWEIADSEAVTLLGGIEKRTYQRWKFGEFGRVGPEQATRLSNLLGIHTALRLLFRDAARAHGWIKRPSRDFVGRTALEVMLGGQLTDLVRVRRYLDAQRGR